MPSRAKATVEEPYKSPDYSIKSITYSQRNDGKEYGNQLLNALPTYEAEKLSPHLRFVNLSYKTVLYQSGDLIDYIYFPMSGLQSLLCISENGASVEVGVVGNEGVLGTPAILEAKTMPYQVITQVEGSALMIKASTLRDQFLRGGLMHQLLLRYASALLVQVAQSVVCNRFHSLEERLCRRLLVIHDRVESNEFRLTQEFLSHILGARRQGITEIASDLQKKGVIRYLNGNITILDHSGLEACSCECYRMVKEAYAQALGI